MNKGLNTKRQYEPRPRTEPLKDEPSKAKRSGVCLWEEIGFQHAMLWRAKRG